MDKTELYVPNLEKWQHYKKRCPPWIKLHRDVLNDYKFSVLHDASKAHLLAIWLLASQMDNRVPNDSKWIARKINATQDIDLAGLIDGGFLGFCGAASKPLANRKQTAPVETETETEAEFLPEEEYNNKRTMYVDGKDIDVDTGEEVTPFG